jgi:hypothetical protein
VGLFQAGTNGWSPAHVSSQEENAMSKIFLFVMVALSGNLWTYFRGLEEVKFTPAIEAQCEHAGILDPDGCPRPAGAADLAGLADPNGGSAP